MSSSPRRSTPDADFGDDPVSEDQGTMQDITISGNGDIVNEDGGGPESQTEHSEVATILDTSALRRYSVWITVCVASSISFASLVVEKSSNQALAERKWCFSVLGISLVISLCVTGCFLAPDTNPCTKAFVSPLSSTGRFIELFLSMLLLILWCIGLPIIMNPSNSIAVGYTQIVNANLYLASWVCFGCVFFIVGDLLGDAFRRHDVSAMIGGQLDPETGEYLTTSPFSPVHYQRLWETRRGKWIALTAITGIAMSESVRTFQAFECDLAAMNSNNTCIDSKVAISMTVLGAILSLAMVCLLSGFDGIGDSLTEYIESIGAVSTTIVWTILLGFVTFGEGPGHSIGNLFFATWGGFIISILITADCFRDRIAQRALAASALVSPNNNDHVELQVAARGDLSDI